MRTINLSDGSEAKLGVFHTVFAVTCKYGKDEFVEEMRGTGVRMTVGDTEVEAFSICKPPDNFNRRLGRKLAAINLLRKLKNSGFNRQDRKTVFACICPEFSQKTTLTEQS